MKNTITIEDVNSSIVAEKDYHLGTKTTAVVLTLSNGFEVLGTSACVDASNYDHEIGKKYAREDAVKKVWAYLAFELQTRLADSKDPSFIEGTV